MKTLSPLPSDDLVETTYGRIRYVRKEGTCDKYSIELVLQQEHIQKLSDGEVKREWVSVPYEFEIKPDPKDRRIRL
jgi:hypothetical protein